MQLQLQIQSSCVPAFNGSGVPVSCLRCVCVPRENVQKSGGEHHHSLCSIFKSLFKTCLNCQLAASSAPFSASFKIVCLLLLQDRSVPL